jgi:transketolase
MKRQHLLKLNKLAKDLKLLGINNICNKITLAISKETDAKNAKPDISYSFILRKLRKKDPEKAKEFQIKFKEAFDEGFLAGLDNFDDAAMLQTIQEMKFDSKDLE